MADRSAKQQELLDQLTNFVDDPNGRRWLNMIAFAEGTSTARSKGNQDGYNISFGGRVFNTEGHPRNLVRHKMPDGRTTTPAGRYQAQPGTWDEFRRATGTPDVFSPRNQDLFAAWATRRRNGLDRILAGDFDGVANSKEMGQEWEAFKRAKAGNYAKTMDQILGFDGNRPPAAEVTPSKDSKGVDTPATKERKQRKQELQRSAEMAAGTAPAGLIESLFSDDEGGGAPAEMPDSPDANALQFQKDGQNYFALPQDPLEVLRFQNIADSGHSLETNNDILRVLAQLQGAESQLGGDEDTASLFDTYPTDNDDLIRQLIQQA